MSVESAKLFIERMRKDEEFVRRVNECKDTEAREAFIKSEGFDFTTDDIKEARGVLATKAWKE